MRLFASRIYPLLARGLGTALIAYLAGLVAACGSAPATHAPAQPVADVQAVLAEAEPGVLASVQPLKVDCAELFAARGKGISQLQPGIPCPLPLWPLPSRSTSALKVEILGKDTFNNSDQAIISGNAIALDSSLEGISWAVYEVPGVAAPHTIDGIEVQAATYSANGGDPGFYVGIANYAAGAWELAGHTTTASWSGTVAATAPYCGPGGRAFIYVLAHGGQALSIDQVTVTLGTEGWSEAVVDAGGNTGWFPAAAFLANGNPVVVYASQGDGRPRMAVGDRAAGIGDPANWSLSVIDSMSDAQVNGTSAAYLDVAISPLGLPRVAMSYLGVSGKGAALNSIACFSVLTNDGTPSDPVLNWLNFRFGDPTTGVGYLDGAEFSSVDYNAVLGNYGSATYLGNANQPELNLEPPYDMLIRLYDFTDAKPRDGLTSETIRRFAQNGTYWFYPHLRFSPDTGRILVCGNGATVYQQGITLSDWSNIYVDADSTTWGSIAFDPISQIAGLSYCRSVPAGTWPPTRLEATYVDEVTNPSSLPVTVDGVDRTAAEEAVALCNELAYAPDGTPCLAYTSFDGTATAIRFAQFDGANWQVEELPFTPSTPTDLSTQVLLDLAVDSLGVPMIAYTYLTGTNAELHVAVRNY